MPAQVCLREQAHAAIQSGKLPARHVRCFAAWEFERQKA
jgi:hypothetical protein